MQAKKQSKMKSLSSRPEDVLAPAELELLKQANLRSRLGMGYTEEINKISRKLESARTRRHKFMTKRFGKQGAAA